MKILKIVGLLSAVCFMSNVQSMHPVVPAHLDLEKRLFYGNLDIESYLSELEKSSPECGGMLSALRTAKYINVENLYYKAMREIPFFVQFLSYQRGSELFKIQSLHNEVLTYIQAIYRTLKDAIADGDAQYGRLS